MRMSLRIALSGLGAQRSPGPWIVTVMLILAASLLCPVAASTVTQWTSHGPEGGAVIALAVDPQTSTTLYAGTQADQVYPPGGVFKSIDGGESWRPIKTWRRANTGSFGALRTLALDPKTPSTIYAGTLSEGIYKSTDSGGSWRPINAGLGDLVTVLPLGERTTVSIESLAVDPETPTTIYARWTSWPFELPSGVYKSTNAGARWIAINAGLPDRSEVLAMAIAPSAPTTIYLSLHSIPSIYKTTDGGTTWIPTGQRLIGGEALVVDPHTPDIVYVNGGPTRTGDGVFKSTDGGRSWRSINTGLTNLHVHTIAIDPRTSTTLYVGTHEYPGQAHGGVFKSIDGGNTWRPINDGLKDLNIVALAIDPKTTSTIYAATGNGVFVLRQ